MTPESRSAVILDLAARALQARSEAAWWEDVAAAVTGRLFNAGVMTVQVFNAAEIFGWYSVVYPASARVRIPVGSPMDRIIAETHPFSERLRGAPAIEPMKVTDLVSARQWRASPAYERVRWLTAGVHHMIVHIPREAPYTESISILRADRDFDATEMELAARLQGVVQLSVEHLRLVERRHRPWGSPGSEEASNAALALNISARERDVLDLLAAGAGTNGIAAQLGITPRTVYVHEQHLYRKLKVHDARNALLRAHRLGLVREPPSPTRRGPQLHALTRREDVVLTLMATGMTNGAIADTLDLSTKTVSVHVSNVLRKLGARTRTEAVAQAIRTGHAR